MGNQETHIRETSAAVRWSRIRGFGKNRLVRSSYLWMVGVPVAARIVHALKDRVREPEWAYNIVQSLHLPFMWQLLFWASLFWAAATLLFDLCCPAIIRDHADWGEFVNAGKDDEHLRRYAEQVAEDRETVLHSDTSPDPTVRRIGRTACIDYHPYSSDVFEIRQIYFEDGFLRLSNPLETRPAFWHVWSAAEPKRRAALLACLFASAAGSIMVLLVFFQNVAWVIREAM